MSAANGWMELSPAYGYGPDEAEPVKGNAFQWCTNKSAGQHGKTENLIANR
jgi:hypothetical protein